MVNLACLYADGLRVGQDLDKAREWFTKAAHRGVEAARAALGDLERLRAEREEQRREEERRRLQARRRALLQQKRDRDELNRLHRRLGRKLVDWGGATKAEEEREARRRPPARKRSRRP